jgi:hypothetical protein
MFSIIYDSIQNASTETEYNNYSINEDGLLISKNKIC